MTHSTFAAVVTTLAVFAAAAAAEPATRPANLEPGQKSAAAVHLWWPCSNPAAAFYDEVTVAESASDTYFCAAGFGHGYFGIQQMDGKQPGRVIFSVWDPAKKGDGVHQASVAETDRASVVYAMPKLHVDRFGNEGTGQHTHLDYDWRVGTTYQFLVTAAVVDGKSRSAAYFKPAAEPAWTHVATLQTDAAGATLSGLYSFVEDFHGRPSDRRRGSFGNAWAEVDGTWRPLTTAEFTTTHKAAGGNLDGGLADDPARFFLQTGGETTRHAAYGQAFDRPAGEFRRPTTMPAAEK